MRYKKKNWGWDGDWNGNIYEPTKNSGTSVKWKPLFSQHHICCELGAEGFRANLQPGIPTSFVPASTFHGVQVAAQFTGRQADMQAGRQAGRKVLPFNLWNQRLVV